MADRRKTRSGPWSRRKASVKSPWARRKKAVRRHAVARAAMPAATGRVLSVAPIAATDFLAAQRANRRNTVWLIVLLLLIGAVFGYVLGWGAEAAYFSDRHPDPFFISLTGLTLAAVLTGIGIVATGVTLMAGDKVVLNMTGAHEVSADDEPVLHNVVEEMAIASGLPKPKVAVIETPAMNAFATGMRPEGAAIGVTRGLLERLDRDELQGVVGHEMGHIANWDIRYMTAVGILVGLIALVADGVRRSLIYSGRSTRRRSGSGKGGGGGLLIIIVIVFSILAPLAAQLVRYAVSRQREYLADATAVQFTRNPAGLIGALDKLGRAAQPFDGANRATQHMFIVNPFRNFTAQASALVATHPPLEDRIHRLRNLGE